MSLKDSLVEKLESQIDAWDKEVEAAKAEAENKKAQAENEMAGAHLKEEMMDDVNAIQAKIESAKQKINEIQGAAEDRLDEFKAQIHDWIG